MSGATGARAGESGAARAPRGREAVRITGIASGGAGVGRLADGRVVFVQRTAPGDRVEIERTVERQRWTRARVVRVLEPGPGRRAAPCPHYVRCGGCTLQHLDPVSQKQAKSAIVAEALRRIGRTDAGEPEVVAAPTEFHYRNRLSFTLLRLGNDRVVAGFHQLERPDRVIDIDDRCLLPEPAVGRAWRSLRAGWGRDANRLPAGAALRLTLRATAAGETSLLVEGGYGDGRPADLMEHVPEITSLWKKPEQSPATLLAGAGTLREVWGGDEVLVDGEVFLQVNRGAAALLEDWVVQRAGEVSGRRVIDAYCGVGIHARRLAGRGARVTGIERDAGAIAEARRAAGASADFLEGEVEALLAAHLPADLVIANPPRTGLDKAVCEALASTPPSRLIYVSCDPATLARDIGRLAARFELRSVRCFDLFPQTAHVETVAELACATS